jgi:hypothetical protein
MSVYKEDRQTIWFSLNVGNQHTADGKYTVYFNMFGKGIPFEMNIRPFAWSHACVQIERDAGNVTIVINGELKFSRVVDDTSFLPGAPTSLTGALLVGLSMYQPADNEKPVLTQTEASISGIKVCRDMVSGVSTVRRRSSPGR